MVREVGTLLSWREHPKPLLRLCPNKGQFGSFPSSPCNLFVCYTSSNNLCEQLLEGNRWEDLEKFFKWKQSKSHNLRTVSCHVTDKIEVVKYNKNIPIVGKTSGKLTKQWLPF